MAPIEQGFATYLAVTAWVLHLSLPVIAAAFWYRSRQIARLEEALRRYNIALKVSRGKKR